jgi:hypothetical protein
MMANIAETYDRAGLKVNFAKTKYLVVGDRQNNNLVINGQVIDICDDYKYLGVTISGEGSSKKELSNTVGQAKQAINKLIPSYGQTASRNRLRKEYTRQ